MKYVFIALNWCSFHQFTVLLKTKNTLATAMVVIHRLHTNIYEYQRNSSISRTFLRCVSTKIPLCKK